MMRRRRPVGVRVRLTLWYVAAMVVVLGVYAAGVFAFVRSSVSRGLDNRLHEDFHWAAEMLDTGPDGAITWPYVPPDDSSDVESSPWLQVWSPSGELLYRTADARRNPVPETDELAADADGRIVSIPQVTPPVRVLSNEWKIGGQPVVLQVARSEDPMLQQLEDLTFILLLGLPLGVAAAGLGGYSLARRALAPVDRMAERARSITAERLRERLPVDNPRDELGKLASVFNETLTPPGVVV